jgi:mono/diheme cytochrome c family protein
MSRRVQYLLISAAGVGFAACAVLVVLNGSGFSAREEPWAIEIILARSARRLAIPESAYGAANPVTPTPQVLADARTHFADHCAVCHANDGSGDTPIGRNLYPKAPDMREDATQSLTDGELFYIITNGIRLSGMPAWGAGGPDDDHGSWGLVHFVRHLSDISDDELEEMQKLNPISSIELSERADEHRQHH